MNNLYVAYPGGRFKALTLSYDDGKLADRRLVALLNKYALKGTFHINSGLMTQPERLPAAEVRGLYEGHEVSVHTVTHPTIARCPRELVAREILDDREALERLVGYPVRGMSYPNGSYDREIIALLPHLGIEYARVVPTTGAFALPEDFLEWKGTCHHNQELLKRADEFLALAKSQYLFLMYVWGHSWEFDRDNNWNVIEEFCAKVAGRDDIWYCTNIEFVDYWNRWKAMRFSADCALATNPSALPVWLSVDGSIVEIPGGMTMALR